MSTKVLVFESDPAFASELRTELGKLGCATTVVDDGNVGLQQASAVKPDLILLSIELPRMNGFSVCNKLKKDAGLKDIPLIIMSSESSDETFEQHKKLRTRAEDYVHKPIAFGELLQHIQTFVALGGEVAPDSESILIEDEIEVGSSDYLVDEAGSKPPAAPAPEQSPASLRMEKVDADVDAFAESAFGRLTEAEAAAPAEARAGHNGAKSAESRVARRSAAPQPARSASVRPQPAPPQGPDQAEFDKLRDELARVKERLVGAEGEIEEARREVEKQRLEAGDAERLGREVEELKTKLASGPRAGISSREFLDLREALNKKDKEILSLKEHQSKKDKEIVESHDKMLVLERSKADLDDRLLALDREVDEIREKNEALAADKDLAKKASEDFKARFDKARNDAETKERQLTELRSRHTGEVAAIEAKLAALRAEVDQTLANERADHARAIDEVEAGRRTDVEQAKHDGEAALAEVRDRAEREQKDAVAAATDQIRKETDAKVGELQRGHDAQLGDVQREHEAKLADLQRTHDGKVGDLERAHEAKLGELQGAHEKALQSTRSEAAEAAIAAEARRESEVGTARREGEEKLAQARSDAEQQERSAIEALRKEHAEKLAAVENDRDSRIAALEAKASRELGEVNDKLAKVEVDFSVVRGELESVREAKRASDEANEAKVSSLEKRLADAEASREALERESTEKRTALERDLSDRKAALEMASARADRAHSKWEADKQSLERAKDALAVALSQIEEAEGRG